ncbi:hypothetical protein HYALB_00011593 [Hymenoscyphus albidus]|uniref:Endo-chitosanase n=1 Tax=Hymenoscyphus albidus TaxID=595503 RepID=A0A9N9Q4U3_9HELO|nr:hypothetical protein HYALB_00011593 [Hymenoscyphus albidus]
MHTYSTLFLAAVIAIRGCASLDIPANVKSFRDGLKTGTCKKPLATGFYAHDDGPNNTAFSYCGDHVDDFKIVYLQGAGGALADMDIDCDGIQKGPGDDGRCGSSSDTQSQTSFQDVVQGYGQDVKDLNAFVHPYVVFGNVGTRAGYKNYNPRNNDINPLSLMAVVCGNKMFYGIWGDENGDDGPKAVIGESSISMATLCFGTSVNGNSGHDETDVLYIAFTGKDAVPGSKAKWNAANVNEFSASIKALGDTLVQRIGGGSAPGTPTTLVTSSTPTATAGPPAATCEWTGHCAGATCQTADDCDGELVCKSGKCASGSTAPPCEWIGHCAGATCQSGDDCDGELVCRSGKCAV